MNSSSTSQSQSPSSVGSLPFPLHTDGTVGVFLVGCVGGSSLGEAGHPREPPLGLSAITVVNKPRFPGLRRKGGSTTGIHLARERTVSLPSLSPHQEVSCGATGGEGGTAEFSGGIYSLALVRE